MTQIPEKPERNNSETASESQSAPIPEQTLQTPPQMNFQTSDVKTSESTTITPTSSNALPAPHSISIPPAIYNAHSSPDSNYANLYTYKYGNVHFQPSAEPPPPYSSVVPARASTSSRPHIVNIVDEERQSGRRQGRRKRQNCSPLPRWVIVLIVIILIPLIISITSVKISGKDPFDGTYSTDTNQPQKDSMT
ncbi:5250_t:CDS:1 [Paraglomus occultum]|uniref:5250_t:CDS:1 n=1 Tax=Paraglomus occultum TaxID=144539 RepID=A0A9N8VCE2_9GLOM|nr:5250_t:CDS:1 [Paraglomus occultum]